MKKAIVWLALVLVVPFAAAACTTALVVIDVQEAFVEEYGWDTTSTDQDIVDAVADLLALARGAGVHVIHIQQLGSPLNTTADDPRAQFPDSIAPLEGEAVFEKRLPDVFTVDAFEEFLVEHGIERLLVAGIASQCVHLTLATGHMRGYETIMIADAHSAEDGTPEGAEAMNQLWRDTRKTVIPMNEIPWGEFACTDD